MNDKDIARIQDVIREMNEFAETHLVPENVAEKALCGLLKYPEEWDIAAYPSIFDAAFETISCYRDEAKYDNG